MMTFYLAYHQCTHILEVLGRHVALYGQSHCAIWHGYVSLLCTLFRS